MIKVSVSVRLFCVFIRSLTWFIYISSVIKSHQIFCFLRVYLFIAKGVLMTFRWYISRTCGRFFNNRFYSGEQRKLSSRTRPFSFDMLPLLTVHYALIFQLTLMFNLRGEPVLFVRDGFDMIPYSPRHQDRLSQCVTGETQSPQQCTELECQLRKEVKTAFITASFFKRWFFSRVSVRLAVCPYRL